MRYDKGLRVICIRIRQCRCQCLHTDLSRDMSYLEILNLLVSPEPNLGYVLDFPSVCQCQSVSVSSTWHDSRLVCRKTLRGTRKYSNVVAVVSELSI